MIARGRLRLVRMVVVLALAAALTAQCEQNATTSPAAREPGPLFATQGAFLVVRPQAPVLVYADVGREREVARLDGGALLQVLWRSESGMFKIQFPDAVEGSRFGWADLGPGSDPRVEPARLAGCPPELRIDHIVGLSDPERLSCFGDRPLLFPAVQFVPVGPTENRIFAGLPAWLADLPQVAIRPLVGSPLPVHLPPQLNPPDEHAWVAVRGQFDDARSAECRRRSTRNGIPDEEPDDAIRWCRQQFVVTDVLKASRPRPETPVPDVDGPGMP